MSEIYTTTVEQDPDDPDGAVLIFPEQLLVDMGWKTGDVLVWTDRGDGSFLLEKNVRKLCMTAETGNIIG